MTPAEQPVARIGVVAEGAARNDLGILSAALEAAFPVRFEPRAPSDLDGLDAIVVLGGEAPPAAQVPVLLLAGDVPKAPPGDVLLADSGSVPVEFRGRRLAEETALARLEAREGDEVLATIGGAPVWMRRRGPGGDVDEAARPAAPSADAPLRQSFREGRFLALLPLLELVRRASAARAWSRPGLRASFLFDDPNLHWTSYGYLRFGEVARRARERGYHVASAMVPLDGWYANRRAARLFRENERFLSLLVHGNDHVRHELVRPASAPAAAALAMAALRRVERFERRAGVPVVRVMTAPHGRCSEPMLSGLRLAGFDAICIGGGRLPWLVEPPAAVARRLTPADLVAGFPVVDRAHLVDPRADLIFRSYLGQPIILYGHHTDLANGLDVLDEAAADVERLGRPEWLPLDRVVASNHETCRAGNRLHVRLFTRRARLAVPEGVEELVLELCGGSGDEDVAVLEGTATPFADGQALLRVRSPGEVEVTVSAWLGDAAPILRTRTRPWPLARRLAVEGRDRALPLVRRRERG